MTTVSETKTEGGLRVGVQKVGTFLSGMVMPAIPALIAWGLLTALFIDVGWLPNEQLSTVVGPFIHYLLPILIAYTGGHIVYGVRGAIVASIALMGVITGSDSLIAQFNADALAADPNAAPLGTIHMFIGAMIMAPIAAYSMKALDKLWDGKIKPGFEMLVNMFSAGIWGFVLLLAGFYPIAWFVNGVMTVLGGAVGWLVDTNLLPLTSIIIEPAKVFFLNNAINHGVLTPLGVEQASTDGKSILFLLEANPGPGVGLLLAFVVFGIGAARASAPGAAVIQFFGGIHEIYFPYALMKPSLIIALIAGGMTGVTTNMLMHTGLRAPAAPGSIIAIIAQTASDSYIGVILSVILSAAVTFLVASIILRASRKKDLAAEAAGEDALAAAVAKNAGNKGGESRVGSLLGADASTEGAQAGVALDTRLQNIVFACDAGMGSSAMGASVLRNKLKKAGVTDVNVTNVAIANLSDDVDLVITHKDLTDRARQKTPGAEHVSVDNFMNSPKYDEVVNRVAAQHTQP
ncbi:PTS mannitol transporter subunit IICB [Agreia sp. COWG]|uniref:PTS mannitol transporter subunit IICB n=1 Tax=Agreia sp. COWG TaxID=2773266 RepID=UPI001925DDE5|nr:PTS mannitol transporter subunit IICB [Agreia sp. COWG]